jgi:glycosyltransferase involved in cell wall biosynthesis
MRSTPLSIAFVIRDPLPPLRADVLTLFGAEMPRYGIGTELVGQAGNQGRPAPWSAGAMHAVGSLKNRLSSVLTPFWDALGLLRARRHGPFDCIQVRDKIASGLMGRIAARLLGVPFVYWMSFPIVEGFDARRDEIGRRGRGLRWCGHALRAALSRFAIYRLVLPGARHIFVQSDAMADWLAAKGYPRTRMTAVPMGVDAELFRREAVAPVQDARLDGRRVIIYLGRIGQARRSDFLLDVVAALRQHEPGILLVIAGDAASPDEMEWMRSCIAGRALEHHVLLTGWLPQSAALGYAVRAEVGLSPIPRGTLFDVSSPTKLVEYLALGIPSVANDIPDQQLVVTRSGAGLCAPMEAGAFCEAVLELLRNPVMAAQFAARGPDWVRNNRTYEVLARAVAVAYDKILPDRLSD